MTPDIRSSSLTQIGLQISRWRIKLRLWKAMAVSQAFIFHFKCYSILHFVVCQLLCWAFLFIRRTKLWFVCSSRQVALLLSVSYDVPSWWSSYCTSVRLSALPSVCLSVRHLCPAGRPFVLCPSERPPAQPSVRPSFCPSVWRVHRLRLLLRSSLCTPVYSPVSVYSHVFARV